MTEHAHRKELKRSKRTKMLHAGFGWLHIRDEEYGYEELATQR